MDYTIEPLSGIGPLRFGMSRAEVRRAAASPVEEFWKSPDDEAPTDAFDELGFHAYYDRRHRLEAVELFTPAKPSWRGRDLLTLPAGELRELLAAGDPDLEEEEEGLTAPGLGLGAYAPEWQYDPRLFPEGIIVFRAGYYDG